ncbi:heme oxygenase (biliverdin-producing) [Mycobacterium paraterrae]
MNAAVPAADKQLSAVMRAASQREHDLAESSPFFAELLGGRLGKEAYVAYLLRLQVVYAALEERVRAHRRDPLVAAVYDPGLERRAAIDADVLTWSDGSPGMLMSPAAESYRSRLLSVDDGAALVAHHYTRYLGDLSGGQVIGRTLDSVFQLGGTGLELYRFPSRPKLLKDRYRNSLDSLSPNAEQVDTLMREVKLAFQLNQALLDELASTYVVSRSRDE